MTNTLQPYPEYKDSGVPWLGKIPKHWELFRNGRLFSQRNETGFGELPILEVSLKTGVRVRDMENLQRKQVMSDREKYKRARQGDIAYNMMRMWQGAVGVAPVDGLVSPAYVVVRPFPEVDCRYYSYLFRTAPYMNEVDAHSRGIVKDRNRLYWQDFKRMPSPVPPPEEQRKISGFLDAISNKTWRFIRNKRRLIELFKEQKQTIINETVTGKCEVRRVKGKNGKERLEVFPTPPRKLRPSNVEWLGDIPRHWEVRRLKSIAKVTLGKMLKTSPSKGDLLKPYLRSTNIQWFEVNLSDVASMWFSRSEMEQYRISKNDILVSEGGDVGRACVWQEELEECYIQNSVHKVTTCPEVLPLFLLYQFSAFDSRGVFKAIVNRVSIAHLTREKLVTVSCCKPPLEEQRTILEYINEKCSKIDRAIARAEREIELIREYRARLISDVVTGQVDVRSVKCEEGSANEEFVEDFDEAEDETEFLAVAENGE